MGLLLIRTFFLCPSLTNLIKWKPLNCNIKFGFHRFTAITLFECKKIQMATQINNLTKISKVRHLELLLRNSFAKINKSRFYLESIRNPRTLSHIQSFEILLCPNACFDFIHCYSNIFVIILFYFPSVKFKVY